MRKLWYLNKIMKSPLIMPVTVSHDGTEIFYSSQSARRQSKGTIVFLHGVFTRGKDWQYHGYYDILQEYDKIAIDLRGHGMSGKDYNMENYQPTLQAKDILSVIEKERIDKIIVWGYSYGARMAMAFAIQYPHLVEKIIMGGMHPYAVTNVHDAVRSRQNIIREGMEQWVAYLNKQGIKQSDYAIETLLANDHQALVTVDHAILEWKGFVDLGTVQVKEIDVILYVGERDKSYRPLAERYSSENDNAQLIVVKGKNHFTANFDSEDIVNILKKNLVL